MKTVRCFLAVNLELKTAKKISELQQKLIEESKPFQSIFKWVPPQNMHVTIRFLGNITEPMIQAIKDGLEPLTRSSSPFIVETGAISTFDSRDIRVLFASINDLGGGLTQLVEKTHDVLDNIGFKKVDKPFTPHITLARIKDAVQEEIDQLLLAHPNGECGESQIHDLVCYHSQISQAGVDYRLLWKLPLLKRMQKDTGSTDVSIDPEEVISPDSIPSNDIRDENETSKLSEQGEQES